MKNINLLIIFVLSQFLGFTQVVNSEFESLKNSNTWELKFEETVPKTGKINGILMV